MPQHDEAVIEPSTAYVFTAPLGATAPTLATVTEFDSASPNVLGDATSEVQTVTITGTPTGGTFTLTFSGATTSTIAYNATAATVQTALNGLSNIDPGDVAVTGGPGPGTPWVVTFGGAYAGVDVPTMTGSAVGLTGGTTPAVNVAVTTPGSSTMTGWKYVGHTDLDEDFEADEEGGDSEVRGTRQTPALRERVEATTEYVGLNLVQLDRDSFTLYYGGGTAGVGFFDSPDSTAAAELAVLVIYIDGTSTVRRVGEYHPKASVRRNGPVSREAEGFMRLPIRYTPLKMQGQPVTRWLGETVGN